MATNATAAGRTTAYPVRGGPWWVMPLFTAVVLGGFGLYATFRAFEGFSWFRQWEGVHRAQSVIIKGEAAEVEGIWKVKSPQGFGEYLSPFFSPPVAEWLGIQGVIPTSLLILIFPLSFRLTCYYYRKAYYRAFFFDPVACGIPERRKRYFGETVLPFVLLNLHRITFFFAAIFIFFLTYDAIAACFWNGSLSISLGSLIFILNVILLSGYTFGCHSFRHLIGGKIDCFSCASGRAFYGPWKTVSKLNSRHMLWAWTSLFSVAITDIYVRMLTTGAIQDIRFF